MKTPKHTFLEGCFFHEPHRATPLMGLMSNQRLTTVLAVAGSNSPGLERLEKYVITIFGPDGMEIRPFKGNNMINSGYLTDFNHDGILEKLDHTNYGVENRHNVQVLELRTVEREPRKLLNVLYNWHPRKADEANAWDYECFDDDEDGLIEIGFGPRDQERRREVVFRWEKRDTVQRIFLFPRCALDTRPRQARDSEGATR